MLFNLTMIFKDKEPLVKKNITLETVNVILDTYGVRYNLVIAMLEPVEDRLATINYAYEASSTLPVLWKN